ncbi:hypothetical protein [Spirosoma luteum]|uniref:hypothetical protein n=1 Tax=Spirosoma luteum TaxID=431553 RepID=UPI00036FA6E7|nr:hypothetical protein [Spirosoma luteum]
MRNPSLYIFLIVLIVLDAWLLAHPNIVGKAGIFFFDYGAIETFPKALGTVSLVVVVAALMAWGIRQLSQPLCIGITIALLAGAIYYLFQSFTQYNTGIYKLTGAGFRAGAILLPGLVVLVLGESLLRRLR